MAVAVSIHSKLAVCFAHSYCHIDLDTAMSENVSSRNR